MASDEEKITVKFLVHKKQRRVVYAEADKDFVDVLFSFLTLPLGTIVRVLHKQSSLGCIDNLYESVEKLDVCHLQTEACRTMLLHPRSEAALMCEDLRISVDDMKPRASYVCNNDACCSKQTCFGSFVQNAPCVYCKGDMDSVKTWRKSVASAEKLFVKGGGVRFIISDDLHVEPASVMHVLSLLKKIGIKDSSVLEERQMDLGIDEILLLLKGLLVSEMPLTDLCFHHKVNIHDDASHQVLKSGTNEEDTTAGGISVKLLLNKANNRVLSLEGGDDFLNQLFSFLTLPLGSVVKILNKNSVTGCIDNLYTSVENLSLEYILSEECRTMLLSPKLGAFFCCSNGLLKLDEKEPRKGSTHGCLICYWKNNSRSCTSAKCDHGVGTSNFIEFNPKSPQGSTEKGGGYVKGPGTFVVTDDLCVTPFSTSSAIHILSQPYSSLDNVVLREVKVGEVQVLNLLKAAVISKTPLTDIFSPVQNPTKRSSRCSIRSFRKAKLPEEIKTKLSNLHESRCQPVMMKWDIITRSIATKKTLSRMKLASDKSEATCGASSSGLMASFWLIMHIIVWTFSLYHLSF